MSAWSNAATALSLAIAAGAAAHIEAATALSLDDLQPVLAVSNPITPSPVAPTSTGRAEAASVYVAQDVVVDTEGSTTGNAGDRRFVCSTDSSGNFTVMYRPQAQNQTYPWATPGTMGGGWSPQRRCETIASRLETYRPDGLLELRTGTENGYNTVCATTEAVPGCRIVFTVPPGQDPVTTRDLVFENILLADEGTRTRGVTTFAGSGNSLGDLFSRDRRQRAAGINLRPFLAPDDGGTGAQLAPSPSTSPQPAPASATEPAASNPEPAQIPSWRDLFDPGRFF